VRSKAEGEVGWTSLRLKSRAWGGGEDGAAPKT